MTNITPTAATTSGITAIMLKLDWLVFSVAIQDFAHPVESAGVVLLYPGTPSQLLVVLPKIKGAILISITIPMKRVIAPITLPSMDLIGMDRL